MEGDLGISFSPREVAPGEVAVAKFDRRVVVCVAPDGEAAEEFRVLAARIEILAGRGMRRIGITSPDDGDGRTTACVNLALALGRRQRVMLVEADFRRPSLHHAFGIQPVLGLVDVVAGRATVDQATVRFGDGMIDLLPAGATTAPHAVVAAPRMRQLLADLGGRYDVVIVDTPSVLGSADVLTLAGSLDGLVMVARAGRTARRRYQRAVEELPEGSLVGTVLTGVKGEG